MRAKEFLIERVLNLWSADEKNKYADQVWDMLQKSYKDVEGGFRSAETPEELIAEPGYWKVIVRNGKISALNIYKRSTKTKNFKTIASATETVLDPETGKYRPTEQGRKDYEMLKNADISLKRSWAEVSGKPERIMQKSGATPIPARFAGLLTGKRILQVNDDGLHYVRLIHGEAHEKVIYGFAELTPEAIQELESLGIELHELPSNISI